MRHTTIIRTAATTAAAALLTMGPATAALATETTDDQGEGSTLIWELATKLPVPEDPCADYEQQLLEDDPTGSIPPELLDSYDEDCEDGNASDGAEDPTDDVTDPEPEGEPGDQEEPEGEDDAGQDETATGDPQGTDAPGDTDPTPAPEPPTTSGGGEVDSTSSSSETPPSAPSEAEDAVTTATVGLDTASAPEVHATPLAAPTAGETGPSPALVALTLGLTGALLMGSGVVVGHTIAARRR